MEVFEGWEGIVLTLTNARKTVLMVCASFAGVCFLVFVCMEIWKMLVEGDRSVLNFSGFARVGLVLLLLFNYAEITELFGNTLFEFAKNVRYSNPELAKHQDMDLAEYVIANPIVYHLEAASKNLAEPDNTTVPETELEMSEMLPWNMVSSVVEFFNDFIANALMMSSGLIIILVRFVMVGIKNMAYFFLMVAGPIPIVLSIIPGLSGFTAHWIKSFITVGMWGVTIAVLDLVLVNIRFLFELDVLTGAGNEYAFALVSWLLIIGYCLVPFLTSLLVGQTAVQAFGSKVVGVVTTAATVAAGAAVSRGVSQAAASRSAAQPAAAAAGKGASQPAAAGGSSQQRQSQSLVPSGGNTTTNSGPRTAFDSGSRTASNSGSGFESGASSGPGRYESYTRSGYSPTNSTFSQHGNSGGGVFYQASSYSQNNSRRLPGRAQKQLSEARTIKLLPSPEDQDKD